ncbi:hypothetical protein [Methylobacterium sp. 190mf]|uniref:hypothetical protein n=1 Tax=Methylobacterium sp. 190mf TaxID=1761798 RepID=UPI0011B07A19|nr:hypothetical protein [Methylobacterium sp. 190mf]
MAAMKGLRDALEAYWITKICEVEASEPRRRIVRQARPEKSVGALPISDRTMAMSLTNRTARVASKFCIQNSLLAKHVILH